MRCKNFFISVLLFVSSILFAHESNHIRAPLKITLHEAVFLALRYNPNVKTAELQRIIDKFNLVVSYNEFEWFHMVTGSTTFNRKKTNGSVSKSTNVNLDYTGTLKMPIGTEITTTINNPYDGQFYNPKGTIEIKQPLSRGFGVDVTMADLFTSLDQEKINRLTLRNNISTVVTTVIFDYRAMLEARYNIIIQETNLKDAKENLSQTKIKIKAGVLPPRETVEVQRQIASQEVALEDVKNAYQQAKLKLLNDLWLDPNVPITLDANLSEDYSKQELPDINSSTSLALNNNIDYVSALIGFDIIKRGLLVAQDNARVAFNVTARASGGGAMGRGRNAGVGSIFNGDNYEQTIMLDLEIPIDDKKLQQAIVNAHTNLQKTELDLAANQRNLEDGVKNAIRDLGSQQRQIKLSIEAEKYAVESLNLEKIKLLYGKSTAINVTTARRNLINAQVVVVRQKIAYLNTLTSFVDLLGLTTADWKINVRY